MLNISPVAAHEAPRWTAQDRSLLVDSVATPESLRERLVLHWASVRPYVKTYVVDAPEDAECHVAFVGDEAVGELRCARHWNGYLCVHDLVVGAAFRRQGVGLALVQHAKARARALRLAGVTLETQNTNLPACQLYERCGFELGGFDRLVYMALEEGSSEIALFWYWVVSDAG